MRDNGVSRCLRVSRPEVTAPCQYVNHSEASVHTMGSQPTVGTSRVVVSLLQLFTGDVCVLVVKGLEKKKSYSDESLFYFA